MRCPGKPDEKGKRLKSATAPATVSEDASFMKATGKLGRLTVADESSVRRPAYMKRTVLPSEGRSFGLM